jgi:unsaturated rhamnogalacturonyl hydrolase
MIFSWNRKFHAETELDCCILWFVNSMSRETLKMKWTNLKRLLARSLATSVVVSIVHLAVAQGALSPSAPQSESTPLRADLSRAVVETTMLRIPDATGLGKWGYQQALYLYSELRVYKRTGDKRYLDYVKSWADAHVDTNGKIDRSIDALDYMLPGNLMLALYKETSDKRYAIAAQTIRHRLDTYPRTDDGGLWHATSRQHQLWLDGTYMSLPFLVHYGKIFDDRKYAYDEATRQLLLYAEHLNDPSTGLLFHAYDESGAQPWADPETHHSSVFWARSIGWYGMALIDVLETLPKDHPNRPKLITLVRQLAKAYATYQDPDTGLWFNVVNLPQQSGNWLETSASSMYVYLLQKAVQRGYIGAQYQRIACKGYHGVLSQVTATADGEVHIANICDGTNVGQLQFYLDRPRKTDDLHGLGAFILMNEVMSQSPCARSIKSTIRSAK